MKNHWIKILFISLFIITSLTAKSQTGVRTWQTHFAYHESTLVAETGSLIFSVYDGSLLSYDPEYQEVKTYSRADGLNDLGITAIKYSPEHKALVIAYKNLNVDVYYGQNNVVNYPFIKDKSTTHMRINNVELIDNYIYFSTGFGISVLDLTREEHKQDYKLNENVLSVCKKGNYLYAATSSGIKKGLVSLNLQDKESWEDTPELNYRDYPENLRHLVVFNNKLVAQGIYNVAVEDANGELKSFLSGNFKQTAILNNELVIVAKNQILFYSDFSTKTTINLDVNYIDSRHSGKYWIAMGEEGLSGIEKKNSEYTIILPGIKINSPKKNWNHSMKFLDGKLYILGGGRADNRFLREGVLMFYENGEWSSLNTSGIQSKTGLPCRDFISLAVDPDDSNHYYISSWGEGVYEFQNDEFVKLYSLGNSSLQTALPNNNAPETFVRVDGLVFDKDKNLYMVNSQVEKAVSILNPNGVWTSKSYTGLVKADVGQVFIDSNNNKWINVWRKNGVGDIPGISVLDDNGAYYNTNNFVDGQDRSVGALYYFCITEDLSGTIWIGTDNGPILLSRPSDVQNATCRRLTASDSDGNGYYVMDGIQVACIAVDGANRKWLGTKGNGVYMIDNTSSELKVENFTISNSLLVSNVINSIVINDETGEVFVGTSEGLMSYQSDAVKGQPDYSDVYAFPNPVYPDKSSASVSITGLMSNSVVKITDMSGNMIMQGNSVGGMFTWDCTDTKGSLVKSGIYLVFAGQEDGSSGVATKIMVIR
jgi:hypothetical protein